LHAYAPNATVWVCPKRKRVNVVYVDGHAASSLPSRLTWGQFFGAFDSNTMLPNSARANSPISKPAYDAVEWSNKPE